VSRTIARSQWGEKRVKKKSSKKELSSGVDSEVQQLGARSKDREIARLRRQVAGVEEAGDAPHATTASENGIR